MRGCLRPRVSSGEVQRKTREQGTVVRPRCADRTAGAARPAGGLPVLTLAVLLSGAVAACSFQSRNRPRAEGGRLTVVAKAGPLGPPTVDQSEGDLAATVPVAGAEIVVVDSRGREVARLRTRADGTAAVSLPEGRYEVRPQPVPGYLGTAPDGVVEITPGRDRDLQLTYDTGVR